MNVKFKNQVVIFLLLIQALTKAGSFTGPSTNSLAGAKVTSANELAWIDSLIKEGTDKLIAAEKWNQAHPEQTVNYTIELDARKWMFSDPANYFPVLEKDKWHYEAGEDGGLGNTAVSEEIEKQLQKFNNPRTDKLRIYSMLIKNFPLKVENPNAKMPETNKNLFYERNRYNLPV